VTYDGPVAFGADGVFYPAGDDGPDLDRPLFWDAAAGGYRDRTDDDPTHLEAYHVGHVELLFEDASVIDVTPAEAQAVRATLAELRAEP